MEDLAKTGAFVVPADPEASRAVLAGRWYANGTPKDLPELLPLPAQVGEGFLEGLETRTGKIEIQPLTLTWIEEAPEHPVRTRGIPPWEGSHAKGLYDRFARQLLTTHPRLRVDHVKNRKVRRPTAFLPAPLLARSWFFVQKGRCR